MPHDAKDFVLCIDSRLRDEGRSISKTLAFGARLG
jgi:hypothetical protein